jgi:hypothetical protein
MRGQRHVAWLAYFPPETRLADYAMNGSGDGGQDRKSYRRFALHSLPRQEPSVARAQSKASLESSWRVTYWDIWFMYFYRRLPEIEGKASRKSLRAPLEAQNPRFKSGRKAEALAEPKRRLEPEGEAEHPVRYPCRCLSNRPGQSDYLSALEARLPIGSGEVESRHRPLIRKRLERPGAQSGNPVTPGSSSTSEPCAQTNNGTAIGSLCKIEKGGF